MKHKRATLVGLSVFLCVVIGLQLINHFVMLREHETDCICSCEETRVGAEVVDLEGRRSSEDSVDHTGTSLFPVEMARKFHNNLNEMLQHLGGMDEVQQALFGENYAHVFQLLSNVKEAFKSKEMLNEKNTRTETIARPAEIQEVCPEKFMGKSLTYGYPFFRKGFATVNCSQHATLHKLVTIIFDDLHTSTLNPPAYKRVLKGIAKYQPMMNAVYITRGAVDRVRGNVKVVRVGEEIKLGEVWSKAMAHVTTKYVMIAPHLVEFDDDINLKRLVRILSHSPNVAIVSGAYRTVRNGHWDIGCQQSRMLNYTLTLQGGYYMSLWECVVCDYSPGPWLARTAELEKLQFDKDLDLGVFHDIFLKVKKQKRISISCPDVMFNIDKTKVKDEQYIDFARKYDIKKIVEPDGQIRWYGCRRGIKHRNGHSCYRSRGVGVPPCDLENLADAIKLIMRECEKAGLFCELQEGTLLGAVKLNKVLPWERDGDLTFLTANYTAFKALAPVFSAAGYSFKSHDSSLWCCADGRKAGGRFSMYADGWSIEMYGQHLMESEMLVARGMKPTKVNFAGQMVTVMRNPGLFARNRYGKMLYRHQEHWMDRGKTSGWHFYNPEVFEDCSVEGHSGCLNQYSTDGNMQFDINRCPCILQTPPT